MKSISALEAKFLRFKLTTNSTNLWKTTDAEKKKMILSNVELLNDEKIVLGFYPDTSSYFWILTNQRLIVWNTELNYFSLLDMKIISVEEIFPNGVSFQEVDSIAMTYRGRPFEFLIEKGTWHAIYSILIFILS